MAAALPLLALAVILATARLRYSQAELDFAAPIPLPPPVWYWAPAVLLAVAVWSYWSYAARRRHTFPANVSNRHAPYLVVSLVLFYAVVFALIWLFMPPEGLPPVMIAGTIGILLVAVWMVRHDRRQAPPAGRSLDKTDAPAAYGFKTTARRLALPTALLVIIPLLLGLVFHVTVEAGAVLYSLLLYPVYAVVQLAVFLLLPAHRLGRLDMTARQIVGCCAALFALVHWPNPVVMAASLAGMCLWATTYLRHRNLPAVALSMGLVATAFSQFLPHDWTDHMRVGPGFTRQRALVALARTGVVDGRRPDTGDFLTELYPGIVGRAATRIEIDRWRRTIDEARRYTIVWQFFSSDEYHRRLAGGGDSTGDAAHTELAAPPEHLHWTALSAAWRDSITHYGSRQYYKTNGGTLTGFLTGLYRDILRRTVEAEQLATWQPTLAPRQRERLVEVLLERRKQLAAAPFDTLAVEQLLLHH